VTETLTMRDELDSVLLAVESDSISHVPALPRKRERVALKVNEKWVCSSVGHSGYKRR
jgi:hypothetical protein